MNDIQFIKGDARYLPIEDESVQCIVTSPPYWGLRKYIGEQEVDWPDGRFAYGLEPTIEMYVSHTVTILREMRRVLRNDGVLFLNIGDRYAAGKPKDLCLIPARVAIAAQADGWWVRSIIVWAKPNPMPESCKDRPTDSYEHIIMLTKSARYFWDFEACQEPAATDDMRRPYGSEGMWAMDGRPLELRHGGKPRAHAPGAVNEVITHRNIRNVWHFATQPYAAAHFATFPEELPRRCILAATKVGDTVLDPFAGSGTVGRVAIELNRKAILNDLAYHDLSEKRTNNVQRVLI